MLLHTVEMSVDHVRKHRLEACLGGPAEFLARPAGVGDRLAGFDRAGKAAVDHHVIMPVGADLGVCSLAHVTNGVLHTSADYVIVGHVLLQHKPGRLHVIVGESPVAHHVEIAKRQFSRMHDGFAALVELRELVMPSLAQAAP